LLLSVEHFGYSLICIMWRKERHSMVVEWEKGGKECLIMFSFEGENITGPNFVGAFS